MAIFGGFCDFVLVFVESEDWLRFLRVGRDVQFDFIIILMRYFLDFVGLRGMISDGRFDRFNYFRGLGSR